MRGSIDRAGRVAVPKALRDQLGLVPGPVEIEADGAALRIEPVTRKEFVEKGGRIAIPSPGYSLTDGEVRGLRLSDQR
jgi:bifunctional DNA-binding transcriptional regulator/antitoxin component of YhaV-PrlF toxin-antitoxin module